MRTYETMLVLDPEMSKEQIDGFVEKLKQFLTDRGAEVIKVAEWGLNTLAYAIKKRKKGLLHPAVPERQRGAGRRDGEEPPLDGRGTSLSHRQERRREISRLLGRAQRRSSEAEPVPEATA